MIQIKFKFVDLHRPTHTPVRGSLGAAAFDLYYGDLKQGIRLEPHSTKRVKTNLAIEIPKDYYGQIETRSSTASKGIYITGGIIDSDYRGEIEVILNTTKDSLSLIPGDKIAQLIIHRIPDVLFVEVNELSETERGFGGFGSTNIDYGALGYTPFF